jgi:hypothetical protein
MKYKIKQMNKRKANNNYGLAAVSILIGLGIVFFLRQKYDKDHLRRNAVLTNVTISKYTRNGKGNGGTFYFAFVVKNKTYEKAIGYGALKPGLGNAFVGKNLPLIYDSTDPGNCDLLITSKDFNNYGFAFPDSLRWVEAYFNK